jgi:hypothetical protein
MLIEAPTIASPKSFSHSAAYEAECREALRPHLEAIIDLAVKAGWERSKASYSLMYLAAKAAKTEDADKQGPVTNAPQS